MTTATRTFNAVMVGCGSIVGAWLGALKERSDVRIVGLVDLDPAQAEQRKSEYGLDAVCGSDLAAMLEALKPDLVFDCTVPVAHATVACCALEHGCHVLGEKPLADTMANAKRIVSSAAANERMHAVIQNRRFDSRILRYRDLVQSGQLGQLTELHADFYIGAHFDGFRAEMDHVLLLDMAIHSFDQARLICGKHPEWVQALDWNPAGSSYRHGASALMICGMSDGLTFTYRGSWCPEGMNTSWESSWRAIGTVGSALWDGADSIRAEVVDEAGKPGFFMPVRPIEVPPAPEIKHHGHAGVIDDFIACLSSGDQPQTSCSDNILSMAMVHAAIASAEAEGKRTYIRDLL